MGFSHFFCDGGKDLAIYLGIVCSVQSRFCQACALFLGPFTIKKSVIYELIIVAYLLETIVILKLKSVIYELINPCISTISYYTTTTKHFYNFIYYPKINKGLMFSAVVVVFFFIKKMLGDFIVLVIA